ncbi:hypothetical protein [Streptococcus pantholopis]|uniref:Uncharacterized protein n=1 Tax=Streptococcus pantholopis TaxID=1811193 RepID=A0A172Q871_9STRE|nr:hypothetical protein [Streptococcus pantholopis]AND79638.1 hypothetical protein A0O21_06185 [Streptococcus pantholopis]
MEMIWKHDFSKAESGSYDIIEDRPKILIKKMADAMCFVLAIDLKSRKRLKALQSLQPAAPF